MSCLRLAPERGVQFARIAPGGFRILAALDSCCRAIGVDLVLTSGTEGVHSGPEDPHHRGEAYDVRSHDLEPALRQRVLAWIVLELGDGFYAFLEAPGTANEHFHLQVRRGRTYPPAVSSSPLPTAL